MSAGAESPPGGAPLATRARATIGNSRAAVNRARGGPQRICDTSGPRTGSVPDPKTLTRAARDFADRRPAFAVEAGLAALLWLVEGYGYEVTGADVWAAYTSTMKAAEKAGQAGEVRDRIRTLVASEPHGERFVTRILGQTLGL